MASLPSPAPGGVEDSAGSIKLQVGRAASFDSFDFRVVYQANPLGSESDGCNSGPSEKRISCLRTVFQSIPALNGRHISISELLLHKLELYTAFWEDPKNCPTVHRHSNLSFLICPQLVRVAVKKLACSYSLRESKVLLYEIIWPESAVYIGTLGPEYLYYTQHLLRTQLLGTRHWFWNWGCFDVLRHEIGTRPKMRTKIQCAC